MKGKSLTLFLGLLMLLSINAKAQNGGIIYGSTQVIPGETEYYTAEFLAGVSPWANVVWNCYGGTIVGYSNNPTGLLYCYVQWDNTNGEGWVDIYEDVGGQWGQLTVMRGSSFLPGSIWTGNEYFNHLTPVSVSQDPASGGGGCSFGYTWESSINGGASWVPFGSGLNYPGGAPQNTERVLIRRVAECSGQYENSNVLEFKYRSVSWDNRNFISSNEIWYPDKFDYVAADNLPIGQKQQTTVFYDGLGRPEQSVIAGASAETGNAATSKKDLVTPYEYDALGREVKKHLAYQSGTTDGKFKTGALTAQQTYMSAKYPGESRYYAETEIESSPLNRPIKTKAQGLNWGAAGVGISTSYDLNTSADEVVAWRIDAFTPGAIPVANLPEDLYSAYTLTKITTTDERGKKIVEYQDKEDRVILKKQQLLEGTSLTQGHAGWLCTYYVYDDFGRLRFVIPPKALNELIIASSTVISQTMADGLCYSYTYDRKGRLIEKRLPGADVIWMVYDSRDRLVFSQDGNQREGYTNSLSINEWTFFLYDAQNRQVATGTMRDDNSDPNSQATLQGLIDLPNFQQGEVTITVQTGSSEQLTVHNPVPIFGSPAIYYYDKKINSITYFDQLNAGQFTTETMGYSVVGNIDAPTPSNRTRGMQTGTKIRALDNGPDKYLSTNTVYDEKGRVLQTSTINYINNAIRLTNQYDFTGKVRSSLYREVKTTDITFQPVHHYTTDTYTILSNYEFDHVGRSTKIKKNIAKSFYTTQATDQPNPLVITTGERTVVENKFDELGQLQTKTLAPGYNGPNGAWLEKLNYEYNIRGWITGINKAYVSNNSATGSFFGMELGYDKPGDAAFANTILNSNVAGMAWKTAGNNKPRKFDYTYDNLNRLTSATFKQRNDFGSPGNWANNLYDFSVPVIQYDFNGNIIRMEQIGVNFAGIVPMDKMTYGYDPINNKLNWVAEDVNTDYKLNDFTDKNTGVNNIDYTYDYNGNLTEDKNKGITGIKYNYLSLPVQIDFDNNRGNIRYIHDALGNKLQKIVTDNTVTPQAVTTTTYSGPIVYTGSEGFILFEEGRVRLAKAVALNPPLAFTFDYFIKDHLGNVRMVLTEDEQNDQYPAATMETAAAAQEDKYYKINNRTDKPAALQGNPTYDQRYGQKMSKLSTMSGDQKIAPSILLKVMAGDLVRAKTDYYYQSNGAQTNSSTLLNDLVTNLVMHLNAGQAGATAKAQSSTINSNVMTDAIVGSLISSQTSTDDPNRPKAHINYIVFDEQFKALKKGSVQVQASGPLQVPLVPPDVTIDENGWIYVFVNNESLQAVYFDNFQVTHERGNILEENHYYPFGLIMTAISPKAIGVQPNKEQTFQEQRLEDDLGLNWIEFKWRTHDPQTGRFLQLDPLSDDYRYQSPYNFSENRVTDGRELEGLEYVSIHHYANGVNGIKMHYKSTDKEINKINGTTSGVFTSASYGPLGRGVVHYYYNKDGVVEDTRWDLKQLGGNSDFEFHGLYSGPGSITKDGGLGSTNYDFSFQPIDWADAIAKRHDMDYAKATATGEKYAGFVDDVRTIQADRDMVRRVVNILGDIDNVFVKNGVEGVETPYRTSQSGEMRHTLRGQAVVISALAVYKQWKIDNNYGNRDTYDKLREEFAKDHWLTASIVDLISSSNE